VNPYATAQRAYTESSVLTASPERLVVMLYDGAIRFLNQSAAAMREGQRDRSREKMRRAEAIVDELNVSLDMSYGEIPQRLREIYMFCKRTLHTANVRAEPAGIEAVTRLLSELRESWDEIAAKADAERAA
jgi:flagellar secretion chaperone FliS